VQSQQAVDKSFLLVSLKLAEKGQYSCRPNPRVGCVLVKDGDIIGEGWHQVAGQAHAEVNAIADAHSRSNDTTGATAYVSLEPCSFTGKTPPCVDALLAAKVARVVCAILDPNPKVAGNGIAYLQQQGIDAEVLDDQEVKQQAEWLNRGFFKRMRSGLPWVMLKIASSLDGKTADYQGISQWITGEQSREEVHHLRAQSCAVLTGSGTQLADNPSLNVRLDVYDSQFQPYRVLLDSIAQLKELSKIVGEDGKLILFTQPDSVVLQEIESGSTVVRQNPNDLLAVLRYLADEKEVNYVMVEAGAKLAGSFIQKDLVDEINHYIAPIIIGSEARGIVDFKTPLSLSDKKQFTLINTQQFGEDVKITYARPEFFTSN